MWAVNKKGDGVFSAMRRCPSDEKRLEVTKQRVDKVNSDFCRLGYLLASCKIQICCTTAPRISDLSK